MIVLGWAGRDDNKKTDLTGSSGALPLVSQMVLHQAHKVNQGVSWDWPVFEEHLQWKVLQKENHCIPDSDIEEYLAEKLLEDANPYGPSGLPKVVMYRGQEYYLELLKKSSKLKRCDGSDASIEDNAFKKLLKKIF